jgi:hypothetical protein
MLAVCTEITPTTVGRFTKLDESAANKEPAAGIGLTLSVGNLPLRIEKPLSVINMGGV